MMSGSRSINVVKGGPSNDVRGRSLKNFSFYLDLKDYANVQNVTNDILSLGGTVETFLSKDVKYVVTNHASWKPSEKSASSTSSSLPSSRSFSPACISALMDSSSNQESPTIRIYTSVRSRAETLLETARRRNANKGSCDVLNFAHLWGVKVIHVTTLLSRIKKLKCRNLAKHLPTAAETAGKPQGARKSQKVRLLVPYVKYEDNGRLYAPQYRQLRAWPTINFDTDVTRCPFGKGTKQLPVVENKKSFTEATLCMGLKEQRPQNTNRQNTKGDTARKKPGYCEMCSLNYDNIYVHVSTEKHKEFVREKSNFLFLDNKISRLPDMRQLVTTFVSKTRQSRVTNNDRNCSNLSLLHPSGQTQNCDPSDALKMIKSAKRKVDEQCFLSPSSKRNPSNHQEGICDGRGAGRQLKTFKDENCPLAAVLSTIQHNTRMQKSPTVASRTPLRELVANGVATDSESPSQGWHSRASLRIGTSVVNALSGLSQGASTPSAAGTRLLRSTARRRTSSSQVSPKESCNGSSSRVVDGRGASSGIQAADEKHQRAERKSRRALLSASSTAAAVIDHADFLSKKCAKNVEQNSVGLHVLERAVHVEKSVGLHVLTIPADSAVGIRCSNDGHLQQDARDGPEADATAVDHGMQNVCADEPTSEAADDVRRTTDASLKISGSATSIPRVQSILRDVSKVGCDRGAFEDLELRVCDRCLQGVACATSANSDKRVGSESSPAVPMDPLCCSEYFPEDVPWYITNAACCRRPPNDTIDVSGCGEGSRSIANGTKTQMAIPTGRCSEDAGTGSCKDQPVLPKLKLRRVFSDQQKEWACHIVTDKIGS